MAQQPVPAHQELTTALAVGSVTTVPFMDEAGLRYDPKVEFFFRQQHLELWQILNSSCVVEGPPGSGKSTAVWLWLLCQVRDTGNRALWFHYDKLTGWTGMFVDWESEENRHYFTSIENPFVATVGDLNLCVVDGVTRDNLKTAQESWRVAFGKAKKKEKHMIWVTSQQVILPREQLQAHGSRKYSFYSWTETEILQYAQIFKPQQKQEFINQARVETADKRNDWDPIVDFNQAVRIKMHYFGCSARWMFGMAMDLARDDVDEFLTAVDNAEKVQHGLAGARSEAAVNHIIAMHPGSNGRPVFSIAAHYMVKVLSEKVGLKAIRAMYGSHWVQKNPSVHGFVFEWDLLTRLQNKIELVLTRRAVGDEDPGAPVSWTVSQVVPLDEFSRQGPTEAERVLVVPEKWNHPEYDGLYISREQDGLHLVAWNASEAESHKGSVTKLYAMLLRWAQRNAENGEVPIHFTTVRFFFIIPKETSAQFKGESFSDQLLAKNQLNAWGFAGFEVWVTGRCDDI